MPLYLFSNLILAAETPQQNIREKTNGQDTKNITSAKFHMGTKHVTGTVFKTTKKLSYLQIQLSTFDFHHQRAQVTLSML